MVDHDQYGVKAMGDREISDEIHGDLLKGAGAAGRDRGQWGVGGVGIHFVGLASGTAGNEFLDKGSHAWPPIVLLKKGDGVEITTVGAGEGFVDVFDKRVAGRFRDIEAALIV